MNINYTINESIYWHWRYHNLMEILINSTKGINNQQRISKTRSKRLVKNYEHNLECWNSYL